MLTRAVEAGDEVWVYAGGARVLQDKAGPTAAGRLRDLLKDVQWLAACSGEGPLAFEPEGEWLQLAAGLERLPGVSKVLTLCPEWLKAYPDQTISMDGYLSEPPVPAAMPFIDLHMQLREIRAGVEARIDRVLHHGQYILGPEIKEVEDDLAEYVGVKHAITVASGTDALLIALMALNIGPGDEVITVPYTWISTAEVIALLRARTVFVDIEPDTMNMNPDELAKAITPRTKAIMPVGIYGQCADMTRINAIAEKHGIPVIEDAAQCFGATHYGKRSCGLSVIGCTSFFPTKPLGGYGDGGAVFTPDDRLAETMKQIRVHGQKVKHQHPIVGINGRFDTLQAAVLIEKMRLFPAECDLRRKVGERYNALLSGLPGVVTPKIAEGNTSVYAQYTLQVEDPGAVGARLKAAGIPSVSYYAVPLHLQGAFADLGYKRGDFPVAERVASQGLSLPMSPYLKEEEQRRVAAAISAR
ncbi:MAG TPA: DegT/DnrJ/EryC1/StrS family aminotransferase [Kiritimatiellia bacterium]|nr:DegT/DnrJ/EryC1/StrS family aminotransferase [Kiritimatiellia bacterium]